MAIAAPAPLKGPIPHEVPLARAPLVRVIAQVRFPVILSVSSPDRVAGFQDVIREIYPFLVQDKVQSIELGPSGPNVQSETVWRFLDDTKDPKWRVSLGTSFLALEAYSYVSRSDFMLRLRKVLNGLKKSLKPANSLRLGMRYVNRLTGEGFENSASLIQPRILGISLESEFSGSVLQMLTEAQILAKEGYILARWGALQANATYDPDALPPDGYASWVIDLDMYSDNASKFDVDNLCSDALGFSQRLYSVFRGMVTDEFLRFYGGRR